MIGIERGRDAVSRVRTVASDLRGDGGGWVLVAIAVGWALAIGARLVFPALLPAVRRSFGMSLSAAGLLITVLWGAYASMQFPGGILADRYGERAVLVAAIALGDAGRFDAAFFLLAGIAAVVLALGQVLPPVGLAPS